MENDCVDPFFQALLSPEVEGLQGSCRVSTSHFRVNTGATGGALAWARRGGGVTQRSTIWVHPTQVPAQVGVDRVTRTWHIISIDAI